jgi:hypothetical protein
VLRTQLIQLDKALRDAGIPIDGIGMNNNGEINRIDFKPEATEQQRSLAQQMAGNFTPQPEPDWTKLRDRFRTSGLYGIALSLETNKAIILAWVGMVDTEVNSSSPSEADLSFKLNNLISAMGDGATTERRSLLNQILTECDFSIRV